MRLDWAERTGICFGQAMLAKGGDSGKEGVLLRIGWLARVYGGLGQVGLGRSLENKVFCPLSGRDGQDRLVKRRGRRFWAGCAGYCVGNLGEFGGEAENGEDRLDERGVGRF